MDLAHGDAVGAALGFGYQRIYGPRVFFDAVGHIQFFDDVLYVMVAVVAVFVIVTVVIVVVMVIVVVVVFVIVMMMAVAATIVVVAVFAVAMMVTALFPSVNLNDYARSRYPAPLRRFRRHGDAGDTGGVQFVQKRFPLVNQFQKRRRQHVSRGPHAALKV
jgi:hypothetical protein